MENKAPSGINVWQVVTSLLTAFLIAAIGGLFSMYTSKALLEERVSNNKAELETVKQDFKDMRKEFDTYKETTNARLNTVDAIKTSFDNLNRSAQERK